jgi:hypothetical protein
MSKAALPTPGQVERNIVSAQRYWRLWEGRRLRAALDFDPKGALQGIALRREAVEATIAFWQIVADDLKHQRFSPGAYRKGYSTLSDQKKALELRALKYRLRMKAEASRAKWHSISQQD